MANLDLAARYVALVAHQINQVANSQMMAQIEAMLQNTIEALEPTDDGLSFDLPLHDIVALQMEMQIELMDALKEPLTEAVATTFTDDELEGIVTFLESLAGVAYLEKSSSIVMTAMNQSTPIIMGITEKYNDKINALFEQD